MAPRGESSLGRLHSYENPTFGRRFTTDRGPRLVKGAERCRAEAKGDDNDPTDSAASGPSGPMPGFCRSCACAQPRRASVMTATTVVLRVLRPGPARRPYLRAATLAALALVALAAVYALRPASEPSLPAFLSQNLGARADHLPAIHTSEFSARLDDAGYIASAGGTPVSVALAAGSAAPWTPHANGATRPAPFGRE